MKISIGFALAVGLFASAWSLSAAPTELGDIRIGKVDGTVTVIREAKTSTDIKLEDKEQGRSRPEVAIGSRTEAKEGYILRQGEAIETGPNSRAVLLFSNGTAMGVEPNSYFSINKFLQDPFDPNKVNIKAIKTEPTNSITQVTLKKGAILGDVRKLNKGSRIDITTPVGTAGIRGTKFKLTVTSIAADGSFTATLSVDTGKVNFTPTGSNQSIPVTPGNSLQLKGNIGAPVTGGATTALTPEQKQQLEEAFQQFATNISWETETGPMTSTSISLDSLDSGDQGALDVGSLNGVGAAANTGSGGGGGGGGGGGSTGGASNPPSQPSIYNQ